MMFSRSAEKSMVTIMSGVITRVRGGSVYGRFPGLARDQLWEERDLAVTTDFRDVYAQVARRHLGLPELSAILPGYTPKGGEQYTILTATGTITGTFAQITGPGQYTIQYNPNSVVVTLVSPPKIGDLNNDGMVNVTDLFQLLAAWGLCANPCPPSCSADLNSDCKVNGFDLALLLGEWGP